MKTKTFDSLRELPKRATGPLVAVLERDAERQLLVVGRDSLGRPIYAPIRRPRD